MQKTIYPIIIALIFFSYISAAAQSSRAPTNPNSAKACALCHYRWIDTFFVEGKGSDLVAYQSEKIVASKEMCFSCHDGSIADSRARAFNDFMHKIDGPVPQHMKIPGGFPLGKTGGLTCATCHTPHGVPSGPGTDETIFMRFSNKNSALCLLCHPDMSGGTLAGNHPLGRAKRQIPFQLIEQGAHVGKLPNQVVCETCHAAHGSPNERFLIQSARKSVLCLTCHTDKAMLSPGGQKQPNHVVNIKPQKASIPASMIQSGALLGPDSEIICLTCHKAHKNKVKRQLLVVRQDKASTLCLNCHTDKQILFETQHNLARSAPREKNYQGLTTAEGGICSACHLPHQTARNISEEPDNDYTSRLCLSCHREGHIAGTPKMSGNSHPLNVSPFGKKPTESDFTAVDVKKGQLTLPLFNEIGVQDQAGKISCSTCHDPHGSRLESVEKQNKEAAQATSFFLRKASSSLCRECHPSKFAVANSKHDLGKVAPEEQNLLKQTPSRAGVCSSCHIVHGSQQALLWARPIVMASGDPAHDVCASCHHEKGPAGKKIVKDYSHPLNIVPEDKGLTTTLPLFDKKGQRAKNGSLTCYTCHDPHRWDPLEILSEDHFTSEGDARNSFLRLGNSPTPALCENCHPNQAYVEKTDHDLTVFFPAIKNRMNQTPVESGPCGVCHLAHNSQNKGKLWALNYGAGDSIAAGMCTVCHSKSGVAENKIPEIATHPEGTLIVNIGRNQKGRPDYFPLFHQTTGEPVSSGDISCPSCHNVHQWDPSSPAKGNGNLLEGNAANSFLRMRSDRFLCKDCHGIEALLRLYYFHVPGKRVFLGD